MNQIQQITSDAYQTQTLILPSGTPVTIVFYFMPQQYAWTIQSLTYGSFTLQGIKIVNSLNVLHQWRNQLPFGIACMSSNNRDPSQLQDFSSGACALYVLSQAEVAQVQSMLVSGTA